MELRVSGKRDLLESRLTVADGGAQVSGRGLREGKPGVAAGYRGRQPMYRREMEADEANPRRRRSWRSPRK